MPVSFDIAPAATWVKQIAEKTGSAGKADDTGISYLFVDRQEKVEPRASYYHEMRRITSENGVQNGASITASFDPSYERLTFHFIQLLRKGAASNRLDRSQIKLLQRETEMERFVYDGSYTAQCELEDVRVGDVIEFAYTTEGANPVLNGKYSTSFRTQWSFPVRRTVLRFVYPSNRELRFKVRNGRINPKITTEGGLTEWFYEESEIAARQIESDTPEDYYPRRSVQITEFGSWAELAEWALPLFRTEMPPSRELSAESEKLRAILDVEERILTALRFVQDEIRYLGIESGPGSHKPTPPDEVLRRRFGDCKDKVLLLTALLRSAGIDATPALVSTKYRSAVNERLPAPEIFDHAILQVRLGDRTHWIDPTRANQRGPLSQIYVTNCGHALVLRTGATELTAYSPPPQSWPRKKIVENYRIPAPEAAGELEVITEYRGLWADRTRDSFQENTRDEFQKKYLQFYARSFPEIKIKHALTYEELPGENGCRVTEVYLIPKIWQLDEDKSRFQILLYPSEVDAAIGFAASPQREDPLTLDPASVVEEINADMFEDWPLNAKNQNVANEFFRFRDEAQMRGQRLQLRYYYETLADRVPVAGLTKYNADLTRIKDTLGYNLSYATPEQLKSIRGWRGFNWPIVLLLAGVMAAATYLGVRYFRRSKLSAPLPPPLPDHQPLEGIGGWLVLVAIGLVFNPLHFIRSDVDVCAAVFNLQTWRALTDPGEAAYHPYWAPGLLFELFFNSLGLVFSLLLLALFFKKRAAWPRCFVIFLGANVLGVCLDTLITQQIPRAAEPTAAWVGELVGIVVSAAIWIPYALVSKRVQATFRY